MKEAIGGVSIFQIVILFILLFTAIMCLTINNANAFQVKDEIVNVIELNNGKITSSNGKLTTEIIDVIEATSYRTRGNCPNDYVGFDRNGNKVNDGKNAAICIRCVNTTDDIKNVLGNKFKKQGSKVNSAYYQVLVFYQLDLPVIRQIYDFTSKGETKLLYSTNELDQNVCGDR